MNKTKRIITNAVVSVFQTLFTGVFLFLLYRYILSVLGPVKLGLWSLVLATTSATRIAQFGLSGSVVKFVAKYRARDEQETVNHLMDTAVISIGGFLGIGLAACYPLIQWVLGRVVPSESLGDAYLLLPYAIASLWITSIAGVYQSGLDGCQRIDLRSSLMMVTNVVYLVLVFLLLPRHGLLGLAHAQVAQATCLLILNLAVFHTVARTPIRIPWRWNKPLFKEMILYGTNIQINGIAQLLFGPTTKLLLANTGSLSAVGYFEMASRMIMQFRALLLSANTVLVPTIADLTESAPDRVPRVYAASLQMAIYVSLPLFTGIMAASPIISELWIGHLEPSFVGMVLLLSVAWFVNTLSAPAYIANLGIGKLRWNTISHVTMGILNLGLGALLGRYFGVVGVVAAVGISLSVASLIVVLAYHSEHGVTLGDSVTGKSMVLAAACVAGGLASLGTYSLGRNQIESALLYAICLVLYGLLVAVPLWRHPMRTRMVTWLHPLMSAMPRRTP